MKNYLLLFIAFCSMLREFGSNQTFFYERMHNFGLGQRIIPTFDSRYAFPEPIPIKKSVIENLNAAYQNMYQGLRQTNDTRVYKKRFDYSPKEVGQHVFFEEIFDCIITHLAIETMEGIPIVVRGGVGYRYFVVVIKAKPWKRLNGSVRAYCKKKYDFSQ
ncbi:uncharacterized protein LOC101736397 [Bombyx mori]|uniref:Uncharacterized protein n=1 Tax=Bombyx mori TaxID=7091 RepID=A0A8R2AL39_BOMMO|nr:uncharacterized protein LOC101736397 [Bombyx mori]